MAVSSEGLLGFVPKLGRRNTCVVVDDRRYESVVNSSAMYPESSANPAIAKIM